MLKTDFQNALNEKIREANMNPVDDCSLLSLFQKITEFFLDRLFQKSQETGEVELVRLNRKFLGIKILRFKFIIGTIKGLIELVDDIYDCIKKDKK